MRLLDAKTGQFRFVHDPRSVRYAIISHTWSQEGEQTYQDMLEIQNTGVHTANHPSTEDRECAHHASCSSHDHVPSLGSDMPSDPDHDHASLPGCILHNPQTAHKARMACILAQLHSIDLVWLDSCCIDKASSAELSEAINSMYEWYEISAVCFVHLADVDASDDPSDPSSQFRKSRWHRRGWTLQELIAPRYVLFFSKDWQLIGTKVSLASVLHEITRINTLVLLHQIPVDVVSVAQRMQWASARETTRIEDEAYSLMGIFNVHMATIYGEGRHAFIRLQEEILKHTNDQSIFAWGPRWNGKNPTEDREAASYHESGTRLLEQAPFVDMYGLLASSPKLFRGARGITVIQHDQFLAKLGI
ncbi:hypothetical protein C8Q74DRAFT_1204091, partial [Fomes fomentarius]